MKPTHSRHSLDQKDSLAAVLPRPAAFTLLELIVIIAVVAVLALTLLPVLAKSNLNSKSFQCLENHRRLVNATRMYSSDYADIFVSAEPVSGRAVWITNYSDTPYYNPYQDLLKSPLWPYLDKTVSSFKCPADPSVLFLAGRYLPRERSYSMSQVFGLGTWLEGIPSSPTIWRTYAKGSEIVNPAKTYLILDEHPLSINDGAFANACTGAQPGDSPGSARIIDYPASWHDGGCTFSFADGRAEIHKWIGTAIKPPLSVDSLPLNVPAGDSYRDIQWLAANTTVRK